MYQDSYPTIDITGMTNNTIYYTARNDTITVTDSVTNQYKWDSNSYVPFSTSTTVNLPLVPGWHTLTVESTDSYNNIAVASIDVGYDLSEFNVVLHSPANNSLITDGQLLNFSIFDVTFATYEWDNDGYQVLFTTPYDLYPSEGFNGLHNLTIQTQDVFGTIDTVYFFYFDNSAPIISLYNVLNNTQQPLGKNIDVEITDYSDLTVLYKWDIDSYSSWNPIGGSIYRTTLPASEGWHYLSVYTNDTFGQENSKLYGFFTNTSFLSVELTSMINASYYLGGNDVEITIYNFNGTVFYFWGSDTPTNGSIYYSSSTNIMTLSGTEGLPNTPGVYQLTVWVGDTVDLLHEYIFLFTVDQEAPTIIPTYGIINNYTRYLDTEILYFTINDNYSLGLVYLSINGAAFQAFSSPYSIYLNTFGEGDHSIEIIAYDIAGNFTNYLLYFTIDISSPSLTVSIPSMVQTPDGKRYIPANTLVSIVMSDDDPNSYSFYTWNSTIYIQFTDYFYLPSIEGTAILRVKANDTLGNTRIRSYTLTIDNSYPTITLNQIENNSRINFYTNLRFTITDINDDTIDTITSKWDIEALASPEESVFTAILPGLYLLFGYSHAYYTIYTRDIVGNQKTYRYDFDLDFEAPIFDLGSLENRSYIRGDSIIEFNIISTDLNLFYYKWDAALDYSILTDPYNISVPTTDGLHTLYVRVEDDSGGAIYPNYNNTKFVFTVDDIAINYITPIDFTDNYYHSMYYGDTFNFSLDVRDTVDNISIPGLSIDILVDSSYNLDISYIALNATAYEFTIEGTNVTNNLFLPISVEIWQYENHKQTITLNMKIYRQMGSIDLIDYSDEITYRDNITISFKLKNALGTTAQEIIFLKINENSLDLSYTCIDIINLIYEVTFNSEDFVSGKGTFNFTLYAESYFYYGVLNESSSISFTIKPIGITLSIEVSNRNIVFGNDLAVYATLLQMDGTAIQSQEIKFCFYISYNDNFTTTVDDVSFIYDENVNRSTTTNNVGIAIVPFTTTEEMKFIIIIVEYSGNQYYDPMSSQFSQFINIVPPSGLSLQMILIIVGSSVLFSIIMAFVIYRVVKPKPFDQLLEKVTEEEIEEYKVEVSPGVSLSIFDQKKGPIPLLGELSLEEPKYASRMRIGVDNFLLKISDQAYSSLGFEEHDDRRRTGSINLPNEDMVGFIHGIQLENKAVRGGFENLSLVVLADIDYGGFLLAFQEFLFPDIDLLAEALVSKEPLPAIKEHIIKIRNKSVAIIIAAQRNEKKTKKKD
ncbi:MAG: hypothetical protein ACFFDW_13035, partial [Candidatus Thorarchaeota archaeon]